MSDVVGRKAVVGAQIERIRDQPRCVRCGGRIQRVPIIERLGPCVYAPYRKSMAEASICIDLECVVVAGPQREPCPRICDGGICPGGGRNVERTCRNWSARQSSQCGDVGISRGTRRSWTDDGKWLIGVNTDEFVVAMGSNVADGQRCVWRNLLLDSQRPRDQRRSLHVRLNSARNKFCSAGRRKRGIDR